MSVQLHYFCRGNGEPVLLLHGLFGAGDNLITLAKTLSEQFCVYSLDLRNHGRSPRQESMTLMEMADDVLAFMDEHNLSAVRLVGHSLGGKVAMQLAVRHPERIAGLVVADIAPVEYPPHHNEVLEALQNLPLTTIRTRAEANNFLLPYIKEEGIRQFLLKSLYKDKQDHFQWRFNLEVIASRYDDLRMAVTGECCSLPCLFIKGEHSGYIRAENQSAIEALFENFSFKMIEGAGHWLHADKPMVFNRLVQRFLSSL